MDNNFQLDPAAEAALMGQAREAINYEPSKDEIPSYSAAIDTAYIQGAVNQEEASASPPALEEEVFRYHEIQDPWSDMNRMEMALVRDATYAKTGNVEEANLAMYGVFKQNKLKQERYNNIGTLESQGFTQQSIDAYIQTGDRGELKRPEARKLGTQEFNTAEHQGTWVIDEATYEPLFQVAKPDQESPYSNITTNAVGQVIGIRKDNGNRVIIDENKTPAKPTTTGTKTGKGSYNYVNSYKSSTTGLDKLNAISDEALKDATGYVSTNFPSVKESTLATERAFGEVATLEVLDQLRLNTGTQTDMDAVMAARAVEGVWDFDRGTFKRGVSKEEAVGAKRQLIKALTLRKKEAMYFEENGKFPPLSTYDTWSEEFKSSGNEDPLGLR